MFVNELIKRDSIPDKTEMHATTTHKFKRDLWTFFNKPEYKDAYFIEYGTSRGYTSMVASYLFKEVHTINNVDDAVSAQYLSSRKNINRHIFDLYSKDVSKWKTIPFGDVYLIDAVHTYEAVLQDIATALEILPSGVSKKVLVFDDYGAFPEVKSAIDKALQSNLIEVIAYIGEEEGYRYGQTIPGHPRILTAPEGIICQQV